MRTWAVSVLDKSGDNTLLNSTRRLLLAGLATAGLIAAAPVLAKNKHDHQSGHDLLNPKGKKDGKHLLHKKGPHTVSVDLKEGKIAGMDVKHDKKGNVPVKKYKTNKKMAAVGGLHTVAYTGMLAQAYSTGTTFIGYAYIDDYGDEQVYWWPYEMMYDPWTGAVEYVPYT